MRTLKNLILVAMVSQAVPCIANAQEVKATWNKENVILPCSQYTPGRPYSADVYVIKGERYSENNYNKILGVPSADSSGKEWYMPGYGSEEGWSRQTAPFSSDEFYLGQKSYRWAEGEIMGEIYMRRTFTLTEDEMPAGSIFLACGHDDAPSEWYINGELVHSVSDGWNNDEYIFLSEEQKALIKCDGSENLLAVHVHQNWGGAYADCGLYAADMSIIRTFLPTVDETSEWPCAYYFLNYNSDLSDAENCKWYENDEDESDWIKGVGPFSNDPNKFFVTEWPSQVRPILVRRHFNLTADDLDVIQESEVTFSCSYDENPIAYLNGVRIWSAEKWNDNDYARMDLTEEQKKLLVSGDNVLAVSLMQGEGGGHIDYGLFIESPYTPGGVTTGVTDVETTPRSDNRIYNLQGQFLGTSTETLQNGIYIRNGKKFVVTK